MTSLILLARFDTAYRDTCSPPAHSHSLPLGSKVVAGVPQLGFWTVCDSLKLNLRWWNLCCVCTGSICGRTMLCSYGTESHGISLSRRVMANRSSGLNLPF